MSFRQALYRSQTHQPLIKTSHESEVNLLGTSVIREISGDIPLSRADWLHNVPRHACRNTASIGQGPRRRIFRPDFARAATIAAGQSPGRLLTELFIETRWPRLSPPREVESISADLIIRRSARQAASGLYRALQLYALRVDLLLPICPAAYVAISEQR